MATNYYDDFDMGADYSDPFQFLGDSPAYGSTLYGLDTGMNYQQPVPDLMANPPSMPDFPLSVPDLNFGQGVTGISSEIGAVNLPDVYIPNFFDTDFGAGGLDANDGGMGYDAVMSKSEQAANLLAQMTKASEDIAEEVLKVNPSRDIINKTYSKESDDLYRGSYKDFMGESYMPPLPPQRGKPGRGVTGSVNAVASAVGLDPSKSGSGILVGASNQPKLIYPSAGMGDPVLGGPSDLTKDSLFKFYTGYDKELASKGIGSGARTTQEAFDLARINDAAKSDELLERFGLDKESLSKRGIDSSYTLEEAQQITQSIESGVSPEVYRDFIKNKAKTIFGSQDSNPASVGSFNNIPAPYTMSNEEQIRSQGNIAKLRQLGVTEEQLSGLNQQLRSVPANQRVGLLESATRAAEADKNNINLIGSVSLNTGGLDAAVSQPTESNSLAAFAREVLPNITPDTARDTIEFVNTINQLAGYGEVRFDSQTGMRAGSSLRAPTERDQIRVLGMTDPQQQRRAAAQLELQEERAAYNADGSPRPITYEQINNPDFVRKNSGIIEKSGQERFIKENGRMPTPQEQGRMRVAQYLTNSEAGKQLFSAISNYAISGDALNEVKSLFNNIRGNSDGEIRDITERINSIAANEASKRASTSAGIAIMEESRKFQQSLQSSDMQDSISRYFQRDPNNPPTDEDKENYSRFITMQAAQPFLNDPKGTIDSTVKNLIALEINSIELRDPGNTKLLRDNDILTSTGGINRELLATYREQAGKDSTPQDRKVLLQEIVKAYDEYEESFIQARTNIDVIRRITFPRWVEIFSNGGIVNIDEERKLQSSRGKNTTTTKTTIPEGGGLTGGGGNEDGNKVDPPVVDPPVVNPPVVDPPVGETGGLGFERTTPQSLIKGALDATGNFFRKQNQAGNLQSNRRGVIRQITNNQLAGLTPEQIEFRDRAENATTPEELDAIRNEAIQAGIITQGL